VQMIDIPGLSIAEFPQQQQRWLRGGFPRATLATSDEAAGRWLESFRATFLERDLPNLGIQVPAATIGRFWSMLAHFHGQIWNASEVARSMDCSNQTAGRYRDVLEGTFMLRVLPPWFENLGKRLVKSPKVYLRDSGMLHHLLGIDTHRGLQSHPRYGASWEGFALEQILNRFGARDSYFWATQAGAELDLLLLRHGQRFGFEFKCSDAPSSSRSMHIASADLGLEHLFVVYPGAMRYPLGPKITALPLMQIPQLDLKSLPPAVA
jgi:uncharacterized protein